MEYACFYGLRHGQVCDLHERVMNVRHTSSDGAVTKDLNEGMVNSTDHEQDWCVGIELLCVLDNDVATVGYKDDEGRGLWSSQSPVPRGLTSHHHTKLTSQENGEGSD